MSRPVLVDTSVWIIASRSGISVTEGDLARFVTCGPVLQELLQGLRPGRESDRLRDGFLAMPVLSDPVPLRLYISAAEIFAQGRRRGLTIRSSFDCLIAAIALDHEAIVWHSDRDFAAIASYTALRTQSW